MSEWLNAGWTKRFITKSPSKNWVLRKAFVDGVLATLQLEVLVSFEGVGKSVVVGMCSSYRIRSDKKDVIRRALMDASRKALHNLGVANVNQSLYDFQNDFYASFSYKVLRWNVRYNVSDVNIKRITRRGKYYNVVKDSKTGRFMGSSKYSPYGSDYFDDRDVTFERL